MKSPLRTARLVSSSAAVALLLAANAPVFVSSRLNDSSNSNSNAHQQHQPQHRALGVNNRFRVSFDPAVSAYEACPTGSVTVTVMNKANTRPLANRKVTLTLQAPSPSTTAVKMVVRTSSAGKADFDYSLTSQQMQELSGQKLACTVRVDNPQVAAGFQTLACPQAVQLCEVPNCADTVGPVICQGDMAFESLCDAVAAGLYPDDCATEDEYEPSCEQVAGFVLCDSTEWYDSLCAAVDDGYTLESMACELVDDAAVPDCAKTGQVVCEGDMVFRNLCGALAGGIAEEDCVPSS